MASSSSSPFRILSVKALTKLPNPKSATELLQRLVQATQALIIRKRWTVGQLVEFYPENKSLLGLNMNAGDRIMIRLRDPHNNHQFLPWQSLLGTMVHELVHIEIGAHSFDFYQMVDQLCDEVQDDILKGRHVTQVSVFDWEGSNGHKLGGSYAIFKPSQPSSAAAAAAERRMKNNTLLGKGWKVGRLHDTVDSELTQRELLLIAAEQRRSNDRQSCSSSKDTDINLTDEEKAIWLIDTDTTEVVLTGSVNNGGYCIPCEPTDTQNNKNNIFNKKRKIPSNTSSRSPEIIRIDIPSSQDDVVVLLSPKEKISNYEETHKKSRVLTVDEAIVVQCEVCLEENRFHDEGIVWKCVWCGTTM